MTSREKPYSALLLVKDTEPIGMFTQSIAARMALNEFVEKAFSHEIGSVPDTIYIVVYRITGKLGQDDSKVVKSVLSFDRDRYARQMSAIIL
jgi:hypothetical protein